MGHSSVTIIVRNAATPLEAEQNAAVLMEDYDADTSSLGKFDWYTIGESELGVYAVKAGVDASKHALGEDPVFGGEPEGLSYRSANIAQKGSIDLEATRTLRGDEGLATVALLTDDGWVEQEGTDEEWAKQFDKALDAAPADAWLVMADIHN